MSFVNGRMKNVSWLNFQAINLRNRQNKIEPIKEGGRKEKVHLEWIAEGREAKFTTRHTFVSIKSELGLARYCQIILSLWQSQEQKPATSYGHLTAKTISTFFVALFPMSKRLDHWLTQIQFELHRFSFTRLEFLCNKYLNYFFFCWFVVEWNFVAKGKAKKSFRNKISFYDKSAKNKWQSITKKNQSCSSPRKVFSCPQLFWFSILILCRALAKNVCVQLGNKSGALFAFFFCTIICARNAQISFFRALNSKARDCLRFLPLAPWQLSS